MHCVPHVVCCAGNTQYEVLQSSSDSLQIGQVPQRGMDHWGQSTRSYSGSGYTLLSLLQNKRARTVPFILSAPIDVSKGVTAVHCSHESDSLVPSCPQVLALWLAYPAILRRVAKGKSCSLATDNNVLWFCVQ